MLYLVTGGSGSGKSAFAERLAAKEYALRKLAGKKYYIATLYPGKDEENLARIQRHRLMRREMGFETVECFHHLEKVTAGGQDLVLLEDLSNLLANEMYLDGGGIRQDGEDVKGIVEPILRLASLAGCMIVVGNEIFSDCAETDEETKRYLRLLGKIHTELAACADGVVEVVYSIPLWKKGKA